MSIAQKLGLELKLPIDAGASSNQSKQALMLALAHPAFRGNLSYGQVVDTRDTVMTTAARGILKDALDIPTDGDQYYLAAVKTNGDAIDVPVLIREGTVNGFLAAHHALTVGQQHDLLTYIKPIDPGQPKDLALVEQHLVQPRTAGANLGGDRHCFLVEAQGQPILLAWGDVITFVCDQWALAKAVNHALLLEHVGPADLNWPKGHDLVFKEIGANAPQKGQFSVVRVNYRGEPMNVAIPLGDAPPFVRGLGIGFGDTELNELSY